jgi:hypothetical protein
MHDNAVVSSYLNCRPLLRPCALPNHVSHLVNQPEIMADEHYTACEFLDHFCEAVDRSYIQVIRRFIEQQDIRPAQRNNGVNQTRLLPVTQPACTATRATAVKLQRNLPVGNSEQPTAVADRQTALLVAPSWTYFPICVICRSPDSPYLPMKPLHSSSVIP